MKSKSILIVGAGPSGLAAAIFLADKGYSPRIIDRKKEISEFSKALGVNPRTLSILEEYGIAEKFLKNGRIMPAMCLWKNEKIVFRNDFSKVKHKYPFILVQTQKESEEILRDELAKRKISVEYATELESFSFDGEKYISSIKNERNENFISDFIIGADGGHSAVRKNSNIHYHEFGYKEEWELYDIELETNVSPDEAHIRAFDEGGMIMIRMKNNLWRVAGNLKGLLNYLPPKTKTGKIVWETKFNVSHKIAESLVNKNVTIIGDAAHLHSPIGGRGMNLGIEDAYLVSKLIHEGKLSEYEKMRLPYLKQTVSRINDMTSFMAGHSGFSRFIRKRLPMIKPFFPVVMARMRNFALAQDH